MKSLFLFFFALSCAPRASVALSFTAVAPSLTVVERLDEYELSFQLRDYSYLNPFDPAQIEVKAVFSSPAHKNYNVNAFCYQDFTRTGPPEKLAAKGPQVWKVRFTPDEEGGWTSVLQARDAKSGQAQYGPVAFTCVASKLRGFVRVDSRDPRYFQYEDGGQYVAIGQNMGWGFWGMQDGTYAYDRWIPKLAEQGGNFIRCWMWPLYGGIEALETPVGDYSARMNHAWRVDYEVEKARQYGVEVMLMLVNHGSVSTQNDAEFTRGPYYQGNGGPCATPLDFFTDLKARELFKRRLRYIVARWGYASNLLAWELCDEIDNTDNFLKDAQVALAVQSWHEEMAAYVRALDPYHMLTTSFSRFQHEPGIFSQPDLDFTQFHLYTTSPDAEDLQAAIIARYRSQFPSKPVLGGEMGFTEGGEFSSAQDPFGIHWHNAQWASLMAGAAGSSAVWWWPDYVDKKGLYFHYRGLSSFFNSLPLAASGMAARRPRVTGAGYADLQVTGYPFYGIKSGSDQYTISADGLLSPAEDQLAGMLYDNRLNRDKRNPPTFNVDYPAAGSFQARVARMGKDAMLDIKVDGSSSQHGNIKPGALVSVPVAAGHHAITVDNAGPGELELTNYIFSAVAPRLKVYALQGPKLVAAWVLNRDYNYMNIRDNKTPAAASGNIQFTGLTDGAWAVEWWDTLKGTITAQSTATVTGGNLSLPVPPTVWDRALRMRYTGAK